MSIAMFRAQMDSFELAVSTLQTMKETSGLKAGRNGAEPVGDESLDAEYQGDLVHSV
jgi:hypothetical protein